MTSLSSYGFVFGSTDSIDTSAKGSSLGTFFLDLSCPRLSHKDGLGWFISIMFTIVNFYFSKLEFVPVHIVGMDFILATFGEEKIIFKD